MLTPLGKALRKYRIDKIITLSKMADALDISPAYLSAIETGKRNITASLFDEVVLFLGLGLAEKKHLKKLADESQDHIRINLTGSCTQSREVIAAFARNFSNLTTNEFAKIKGMLRKYDND